MDILKRSNNFIIYFIKIRIEFLLFIFLFTTWLLYYIPLYQSGFIYWNDFDIVTSISLNGTMNFNQNIELFFIIISSILYKLNITQPEVYHYLSTFLHIATTVCVFYFLKKIFSFFNEKNSSKIIALFCAILFCFNPVNADTIYWIYSIKEIAFAMLCFASLTCYLIYLKNSNTVQNYFLSIFFIILACLSSRYCYQVAFFFFILTFILPHQKSTKTKFYSIIPFLLIAAVSFSIYYRNGYYQYSGITLNSYKDLFVYITTALLTIKELIVPVNLTFYNAPIEKLSQLQINDLALLILAVLTISFLFIQSITRKDKLLFISILLLVILPFVNHAFVESRNVSNLHFLNYATTSGISLLIGSVLIKTNQNNKVCRKQILFGMVFILIVFAGVNSFQRMKVWKNEVVLWDSVIEQYPKSQFALEQKRQAIQLHKEQILKQFGDEIPNVIFTSKSIDIGIANANKQNVRFEFKNSGKTPLIISNVSASCGCTSTNWTNSPVLPNKTGEINATINFDNIRGYFSKSIIVRFNNCNEPFKLTIKGRVQN